MKCCLAVCLVSVCRCRRQKSVAQKCVVVEETEGSYPVSAHG